MLSINTHQERKLVFKLMVDAYMHGETGMAVYPFITLP